MRRLTLFIFVLFLLCTNAGANAAPNSETINKPELTIVAEHWHGKTEDNGAGVYWDIIRKVYGDKYQLNLITTTWNNALRLIKRGEADILIGIYQNEANELLLSERHIDVKYPVHILFKNQLSDRTQVEVLDNKIIAGKKDNGFSHFIPKTASFYGVDDIGSISDLITKGRIDSALVYSYNLHLADPKNQLNHKVLVSDEPVYLAFGHSDSGKVLQNEFDRKFQLLVETDELRNLFASEVEYQHANLDKPREQSVSEKTIVNWHLVPKIYNAKTKQLDVPLWESQSSHYIDSKLSGLSLKININSYKQTLLSLSTEPNTCAFNQRQKITPETKGNVIYSVPINAYIKPRIFMLQESRKQERYNIVPVSLSSLLTAASPWKLAIKKGGTIHRLLDEAISAPAKENLILVESASFYNLAEMLVEKRVDAIVMWPSIMTGYNAERLDKIPFDSLPIQEKTGGDLLTYVACYNDHAGREMITQINLMQADQQHQKAIYQSLLENMDTNSATAYKKALQLMINQ